MKIEVVQKPAHGNLDAHDDGSFKYKADKGFAGTDTWRYRVWDGVAWSNVVTVTMNVSGPATTPRPTPAPTPTADAGPHAAADAGPDPAADDRADRQPAAIAVDRAAADADPHAKRDTAADAHPDSATDADARPIRSSDRATGAPVAPRRTDRSAPGGTE